MQGRTVSTLLRRLKPHRVLVIVTLMLSLLSVFFQVLIPLRIGDAVNAMLGAGQVDFSAVTVQVAYILLLALGIAASEFLKNECTNRLTYQTTAALRKDCFNQIHALSLQTLEQYETGDLVSRLVNDIEQVANGLQQAFLSLFTGIGLILGILVMILRLNATIGLLVIVLTPLSVIVSGWISRSTYHLFNRQMHLRGELGGYLDEIANAQELSKAFTYEDTARERFRQANQRLDTNGVRQQFAGALINPTTRVLNSVVYFVVGFFGSIAVFNGHLTIGTFTGFLTYADQYMKPFNEISNVVNEMQTAFASAERLFQFLDETPQRETGTVTAPARIRGAVTLDGLSFRYDPETPLLENVQLSVAAGETVAIVGETGAGKTTLIQLLMRFLEPTKGRILVDGEDIARWPRDQWRQHIGMVLQDPWIFAGTVRDNIAYGNPRATSEQIEQAAEKAQLAPFIRRMDDGYDTQLEEGGANLSVGQRQLICAARVFLTEPGLLLLDEATSSIDTLTEQSVQRAFDRLMTGRTAFVVAHRLSTIQNADTILVMDHGRIVEQGDHQTLLAKKGAYYRLYQSQFGTLH